MEFWDTTAGGHRISDAPELLARLRVLPRSGYTDAECIHLPASTRVCLVKAALGWQMFPGANSQPEHHVHALPELRNSGAMQPEDIALIGMGLW